MKPLRPQVIRAVAWRLVAELLRRHHQPLQMRVLEMHPAGGQSDCLGLFVPAGDNPFAQNLCLFSVGGEHLHVCEPLQRSSRPEDAPWRDESGMPNYVLGYLTASDPKRMLMSLEDLLGLPHRSPSATTPPILVARIIAALLERHILDRAELDVRCGWFDSSGHGGSGVCDWARLIPDVAAGLPAGAHDWTGQARVAARLWRVQRVTDGAEPAGGIVLDMKTGHAYTDQGLRMADLYGDYRGNGHHLTPIVNRLEGTLLGP